MFRKRLLSLFSASSRRLGVSESNCSNWASIHEARSMLIKNLTGEPTAANMNGTSEPISPADSKFSTKVPLSDTSFPLRLKYRTHAGGVRIGRILEDLDTLAGIASYKHNLSLAVDGKVPLSIVTACVDEISFFPEYFEHSARNDDLILNGEVVWVGRSSMDVLCSLENDKGQPLVQSHFIMVARCPQTGRAAPVVPLKPETEAEIKNYELAEKLNKYRKKADNLNVFKLRPTEEEMSQIHDNYLQTADQKHELGSRSLPDNSVWMKNTKLKSILICQPESRNIHNKIFGGWLMRQSLELAWSVACTVSNGKHRIIFIDDILFKAPVEIGSILFLHSQVIYSEGNKFQVRVRVEKREHTNINGPGVFTNEMQLTFEAEDDVPKVMPETYAESILFLSGRRHFKLHNK
ncbi:unnamed protein product [Oikopleura dioica]|uniref:HotDog ACOT-type domain-containing protein n=1 Tax=Oikopleura dioica TaxID=34765 RepID=E4WUW7_OIKDI|nr:unnamed protein product [Oikopleura dioica]